VSRCPTPEAIAGSGVRLEVGLPLDETVTCVDGRTLVPHRAFGLIRPDTAATAVKTRPQTASDELDPMSDP
jgi:hypothetical protein